MSTCHKVDFIMRNNQWKKHENVFDTIQITKKLICPKGHQHDVLLKCQDGIYSYDKICWQGNKFLNDIKENNIILLYDRQYKEALVLKIISNPIKDKISDIIILRNKKCTIHSLLSFGCITCNDSVEMVFSNKYFENNNKKFTKYMNENFCFENMHSIFRNVEIIGKINASYDVYHRHKCLRTCIAKPKCDLIIQIEETQ